ncbi:Ref family recombination enhancement nuclease [Halocynthiibacter sp. C4]|uniref:Ref family recombination enhancement nuclease n=1 Tax=Halocynthiibacter sp. C4 TaxID=2992758 RepID=UPI00237C0458|nr:Ref family recombination enhancement nuclease [Halocynthiibacter sp. C4]MDE0590450.1 Ref family recombination enhancement nuclease [Halocynthiibacter sp. C4]
MSNLANLPPLGLKEPKQSKDKARLAAVAELDCCICLEYGMPQNSPTQVHHCIMGRHSTRRAPDSMTIPLCEGHHLGMFDASKVAIHREPKSWRESYGADTDWISWTEERLARDTHIANLCRRIEFNANQVQAERALTAERHLVALAIFTAIITILIFLRAIA